MNLKEKLHRIFFPSFANRLGTIRNDYKVCQELYNQEVQKNIFPKVEYISDADFMKLYDDNKDKFHRFMIEEFTGDIPASVKEPAFEIFNTQADDIERWVLWQSYKMRRLVMLAPANPLKIEYYDGVLFFLKFFLELSHSKRTEKTLKPSTQSTISTVIPIESTLPKTLQDFRDGIRKKYESAETPPLGEVITIPDELIDDTIKT